MSASPDTRGQETESPRPDSDRRIGLGAALCAVGLALLLYHGDLVSSDEIIMARAAMSIGFQGSLTFPEIYARTSSNYGTLCSVVGVPFGWLQVALDRLTPLGGANVPVLFNCATALISGVLAWATFGLARASGAGRRASFAATLLLAGATPFLPYSTAFFSEPLAAMCLALAALRLRLTAPDDAPAPVARDYAIAGAWLALALHSRVTTAALVPILLVAALLRTSGVARLKSALFMAIPLAGAVGAKLLVNLAARGGLLAEGYDTSDFTTPLGIGLFGMLVSPERGLAWHATLALFPVCACIFGGDCTAGLGRARRFALAAGAVWLLLHATFWAWHGGWTPAARFLLPVFPFFWPFLAQLFSGWENQRPVVRLGIFAAAAWGGALALGQTLVNPLDWNNELFGHLQESHNAMLFEPATSSLRGIPLLLADERWRWVIGRVLRGEASALFLVLPMLGLLLLIAGLWISNAIDLLGPRVRSELQVARRWLLRGPGHGVAIALGLFVIASAVLSLASGPRGFIEDSSASSVSRRVPRLRHADREQEGGATLTWTGWINTPLDGDHVFHLKAAGAYDVFIDGKKVFSGREANSPRHLGRASVKLSPGLHPIEARLLPSEVKGQRTLNLYWIFPGEGRAWEPVGGAYVWPESPTKLQQAAARIQRKQWILLALLLGLGWMVGAGRRSGNVPRKEVS